MWQSMEILDGFNTLTSIQIFSKTETFFKKLEYYFLVESTKIENTSFLVKSPMSGVNVKTNRVATKNWPITKSGVFLVTVSFFLKICFSFRTP